MLMSVRTFARDGARPNWLLGHHRAASSDSRLTLLDSIRFLDFDYRWLDSFVRRRSDIIVALSCRLEGDISDVP